MKTLILFLIIALWSFSVSGQSKKGELLFPRYAPSAATDGQWIYVFGGSPHGGRNGKDFMNQGLHASIERIDPNTLKSKYYSSGLHRRANHASVIFNNKMVTCGGRSQVGLSRPKMKDCEVLDLATGIFRELPGLPDSLRSIGMTEISGVPYVVGGLIKGNNYSKGIYKLNPGNSEWVSLKDMPIEREGVIVSIGSKIYALSGYNGKAITTVQVFDTQDESWKQLKELPYGLSAYSAVTDGKFIYIFGDYSKMDQIHRYEPETGDLYRLDIKITPRRHTAAVLVNNMAYVIGGNQTSSGKALTLIEAFSISDLKEGGTLMN